MKPVLRSFGAFMKQIAKDSMLWAVCFAPIMVALLFRFGIVRLEHVLCKAFALPSILSGYYLLFDLVLAIMTPYMFCFASSMVMLTEYDENLVSYYAVTPVGRRGYLYSRLGFPAAISFAVSFILLCLFSLTEWSFFLMAVVSVCSGLISVVISLMMFSFSHNRVEGMAVAKLTGLLILGLPAPFFVTGNTQYLFGILPSFWVARLAQTQNLWLALPVFISLGLWAVPVYLRFHKKIGQ